MSGNEKVREAVSEIRKALNRSVTRDVNTQEPNDGHARIWAETENILAALSAPEESAAPSGEDALCVCGHMNRLHMGKPLMCGVCVCSAFAAPPPSPAQAAKSAADRAVAEAVDGMLGLRREGATRIMVGGVLTGVGDPGVHEVTIPAQAPTPAPTREAGCQHPRRERHWNFCVDCGASLRGLLSAFDVATKDAELAKVRKQLDHEQRRTEGLVRMSEAADVTIAKLQEEMARARARLADAEKELDWLDEKRNADNAAATAAYDEQKASADAAEKAVEQIRLEARAVDRRAEEAEKERDAAEKRAEEMAKDREHPCEFCDIEIGKVLDYRGDEDHDTVPGWWVCGWCHNELMQQTQNYACAVAFDLGRGLSGAKETT